MSSHRKRQRIMQDALAYGACTCPRKNTYTSKARAKFAARTSNFRKLHKLRPLQMRVRILSPDNGRCINDRQM